MQAPSTVSIEPAGAGDLRAVAVLLRDAGLPLEGAAESIERGVVARSGDRVVGAAGLERYGATGLLRSVVVAPEHRGSGVGGALVAAIERRADEQDIRALYLFTETAADWFSRLGFEVIPRVEAEAAVGASVEATTVCKDRGVAMRKRLG